MSPYHIGSWLVSITGVIIRWLLTNQLIRFIHLFDSDLRTLEISKL